MKDLLSATLSKRPITPDSPKMGNEPQEQAGSPTSGDGQGPSGTSDNPEPANLTKL